MGVTAFSPCKNKSFWKNLSTSWSHYVEIKMVTKIIQKHYIIKETCFIQRIFELIVNSFSHCLPERNVRMHKPRKTNSKTIFKEEFLKIFM